MLEHARAEVSIDNVNTACAIDRNGAVSCSARGIDESYLPVSANAGRMAQVAVGIRITEVHHTVPILQG
jgi:hypothetical protein